MRKTICILLAVMLCVSWLTGCGKKEPEKVELIVFAAASMTETMNAIAEKYKAAAPEVTLVFNFDSSGTLKTQIQEGADCDIFISASPKQMNQLDGAKDKDGGNPDGLDFVMRGTRFDLLENKVALAVPEGNPGGVTSFDDLFSRLKAKSEELKAGNSDVSFDLMLAMGNSDVPVGQYTQKIIKYYGLDEETLAKSGLITYGSNVKEVTSQVKESTVSCGIIYATDAFSAGLTVVDTATKDMCGQIIYPAAVIKDTKHEKAAKAFLEYLKGSEASEIFKSVGFTPLS